MTYCIIQQQPAFKYGIYYRKKNTVHIQAECHNNYASLSVLPERDE